MPRTKTPRPIKTCVWHLEGGESAVIFHWRIRDAPEGARIRRDRGIAITNAVIPTRDVYKHIFG